MPSYSQMIAEVEERLEAQVDELKKRVSALEVLLLKPKPLTDEEGK